MRKQYKKLQSKLDTADRQLCDLQAKRSDLLHQLRQTDEYKALLELTNDLRPKITRWFHLDDNDWEPGRIYIVGGDPFWADGEFGIPIEVDGHGTLSVPESRIPKKLWKRCLRQLDLIEHIPWKEPKPRFRLVTDPGEISRMARMDNKLVQMPKKPGAI